MHNPWSRLCSSGELGRCYRPDPPGARVKEQAGVILVGAMWAVLAISLLLVPLALLDRHLALNPGSERRVLFAQLQAEGAVAITIANLLNEETAAAMDVSGMPFAMSVLGGDQRVSISDESGKVDLNRAGLELIEAVLRVAGVPGEQAERAAQEIGAWRSASQSSRPGNTPSANTTVPQARSGSTPGFESVDELRRIKNLRRIDLETVLELVTIFSTEVNPIPDVAPARVRTAMSNAGLNVPTGQDSEGIFKGQGQGGGKVGRAYRIAVDVISRGQTIFRTVTTIRVTGDQAEPYWTLSWLSGPATAPLPCATNASLACSSPVPGG